MFECDKCGLCCSHIGDNELYKNLDRGDGVCKFLKDNLCSIYEHRPLLCRVDESWKNIFSSEISLESFYELNYQGCKALKNKYKQEEQNVLKSFER
ncbi:MAG: YkgJ family cysteine cluster protein [Treponema sp.]|jgi:Fe-S-cluster containining protein|nr:YkgJ family cysteine cluster protein [Treponema sp.]